MTLPSGNPTALSGASEDVKLSDNQIDQVQHTPVFDALSNELLEDLVIDRVEKPTNVHF